MPLERAEDSFETLGTCIAVRALQCTQTDLPVSSPLLFLSFSPGFLWLKISDEQNRG